MDPITTALATGAAFVLKGVASEAVKDAYKELKELLAGRLSSLAILEQDPSDTDYRRAAEREVENKGLANDPAVLGKACELAQAVEREPEERLVEAGVDIGGLRAAQDVIIRRLHGAGGVRIKDVQSDQGAIDIQDVSAGTRRKN